jgi:hypothetical protein
MLIKLTAGLHVVFASSYEKSASGNREMQAFSRAFLSIALF